MNKPFLIKSDCSRELLNESGVNLETLDNWGDLEVSGLELENIINTIIERVVYIFQDETSATAEDVNRVFRAIKSEYGV